MWPTRCVEIEAGVLRVLGLRPSDFLVSACRKFARLSSRDNKDRAEHIGRAHLRGKDQVLRRSRLDGQRPAECFDPSCKLHRYYVSLAPQEPCFGRHTSLPSLVAVRSLTSQLRHHYKCNHCLFDEVLVKTLLLHPDQALMSSIFPRHTNLHLDILLEPCVSNEDKNFL
jgi:hypothetical protein